MKSEKHKVFRHSENWILKDNSYDSFKSLALEAFYIMLRIETLLKHGDVLKWVH